MKARNTKRGTKGSCFIECVLGGALLIPIALCMLDLGTLVLGAELNDTLARQAARAAANEQTQALAQNALDQATEAFQTAPSDLITFEEATMNYTTDSVSVKSEVHIKFPFQFPFLSGGTLVAQATMPVIGVVTQ
jgi:Flp pilus assembly protein TadG